MSQPRTVLITGSSSGFGLALTRHFLSHGWNTIATSRNPSRTPELVAEVEAKHSIVGRGRGKWLQLDVCESQEVIDGVIAEAERVFADGKGEGGGGLDVVINNAGYSILGPLETVDEGRGRGMMDANFWGTLKVCKAVIPGMRTRNRGGWIVNFSSIAGLQANANVGVYAASKFAVEAITESLAQELSPFAISCLLVEPGMFATNFFDAGSNASNQNYHLAPLPEVYAGISVETSHQNFQRASETTLRGDVNKAAARVREVVEGELVIDGEKGAVKRLLLGMDAYARAEKCFRGKLEGLQRGREVAGSTDRDDWEG